MANSRKGDDMDKKDESKKMVLYVNAYPDEELAEEDFEALKKLHSEGWVGAYDAGIVTKDADGKLGITTHTDTTRTGAATGLAVGVLLGVIFPPSVLVTSAIGAGAGAVIGHHFNDISKEDLEELGKFLEDNEAALVVIGELRTEEMVKEATKQSLKEYKKEFNANAKEFNEELDKAISEM
jgi:uncharacterized membrane protein